MGGEILLIWNKGMVSIQDFKLGAYSLLVVCRMVGEEALENFQGLYEPSLNVEVEDF